LADSAYPAKLAQAIVNNTDIQKLNPNVEAYAISERVSNDLACKSLHISELITMLGYTKTDIGKILQKVKNEEYRLILVGAGGTGSNFLYWAFKMAEWTGKYEIFKELSVYDDDSFDIPNMLRIPFKPEFYSVSENEANALKVNCLPFKFKTLSSSFRRYPMKFTREDLEAAVRRKTVVYGAPGIETRTWLSESNKVFIAATHKDNEFSLVKNPRVDNDLIMETYGKIELGKFFMNHLLMTIKFLEYLVNTGDINNYDVDEDGNSVLNNTIEENIIRFNFDTEFSLKITNGFKAGSKKLYVGIPGMSEEELNLPEEE
jgi:hypothetical protein